LPPVTGALGQENQSMDIENIVDAIRNNRVRITDHADEEAFDDSLTFEEIYFSVMYDEIIEDYPNDKPYPSCLIMGKNFSGDPIHSVWAYNPINQWTVLVTVYRPDPERWIDWKVRVKK
jgi:hypothetical protein